MSQDKPATQSEKVATAKESAARQASTQNNMELIIADPWMCSVALGILMQDVCSAIVRRIRARKEIARLESWYALPS